MTMLRVRIPIACPNPLNEHAQGRWREMAKRRKQQRAAAFLYLRAAVADRPALPVRITLIRHSVGTLDDDAVPAALKSIRDGVADYFGIADNDTRIAFHYEQQKARRGVYAVTISIESVSERSNEV